MSYITEPLVVVFFENAPISTAAVSRAGVEFAGYDGPYATGLLEAV